MTGGTQPGDGPFDGRAVSNVILDMAEKLNIEIYVTTLLKVLYFAHGWHLARFDRPLVGQPFEAWRHGPVVRVVYDQVKDLSRSKVTRRLKAFDVGSGTFLTAKCDLPKRSEDLISAVLKTYGVFHPYVLSDMTHEPDSPWTSTWTASERGERLGTRIDDIEIRAYFLRLNASDMIGS